MERNNRSVSEHLICKKMREALATFPAFGAISKRFSQHRQNSKTVAIDSNSPPSSPVRPIHVQTKPTTKPQSAPKQDSSSEAIPINFDYTIPSSATRDHAPVTHVRVSETAEKKDINRLFDDFLRDTKYKITMVSNAGRGHQGDNLADDEDNNKDHGTKKKENHREHFSNFIHGARRKIRTTSGIRRE